MLNLNIGGGQSSRESATEDRARSMEVLDAKTAHLMAPENTLKSKAAENRQPSEHELRIQKLLTKINVPEWYRKYDGSKSPAVTVKKEYGSGLAGGWSGLSSKASSLTSLQQHAGRYSSGESRLTSRRLLATGTSSAGGRCGGVTSPNSTSSVSPTPYYERSSFTYGMPYAMTRFGTARMAYGASPASLSPSPSPVAGMASTMSTPTASGPSTRLHAYTKQPYLGWRSQERLAAAGGLYRNPSERLAADFMKSQSPKSDTATSGETSKESSLVNLQISPSSKTASDLSLNNNEESTRHKLNRVRSSIKAVSNAIVDYVNESRPLDETGINGRASPGRGFVWLESSFVGTKPIDSPTTPDTPTLLHKTQSFRQPEKKTLLKTDQPKPPPSSSSSPSPSGFGNAAQSHQSMFSRNDLEERYSNSSSVSSPTLDDILDSLLALRRPQKKFKTKEKGHVTTTTLPSSSGTPQPTGHSTTPSPARSIAKIESSFLTNPAATVDLGMDLTLHVQSITTITPSPISDWQMRMLQPVQDAAEFIFPPQHAGAGGLPDETIEVLCTKDRESLSIPADPTRAFNISPETNIGAHVDSMGEEVDGFSFKMSGKGQFGALADMSLPSSPAKHRRVSFDLEAEDKEEKSSSRSRKDSDSAGGSVIECRNSKCGKSGIGLEARREFKTCHNCNAYYCSRECRRAHWEKHKKVCMQSRVGALCKQIIAQIRDDTEIVTQLSRQSRQGYLAKGRGCIKLFFSSPDRAERFLTGGFPEIPAPWYIGSSDVLPEEIGAQVYAELSDQCQTYNPATRFVLYVSLCVVNEVPTSGAVKWEREMIARSAKLRLVLPRGVEEASPHHQVAAHLHHVGDDVHYLDSVPQPFLSEEYLATHQPSDGETIILRSVPLSSRQLSPTEQRRQREVNFTNIQRHLTERGVKLRRTYPEIYSRLCDYVEKDETFLPVTIHPRNTFTGKLFTCIIMPECTDSGMSGDHDGNEVIDISTPNISTS